MSSHLCLGLPDGLFPVGLPVKILKALQPYIRVYSNIRLSVFYRVPGKLSKGQVEVYHNLDPDFFAVALAGVGPEDAGLNTMENLDEAKENVRVAAATGALALRRANVDEILVEGFNEQVEASAEGACLAVWRYQDFKAKEDQKPVPTLDLYNDPDKYVKLRMNKVVNG